MNTALVHTEESLIQILRAQLPEFGLNPADWLLIPQGPDRVRMTHLQDREFRMIGFFDPIRLNWADLHVVSL